jgi:hypothetical protein
MMKTRKKRTPWTKEHDDELRALRGAGVSLREICEKLTRPMSSVELRIRKLGIVKGAP